VYLDGQGKEKRDADAPAKQKPWMLLGISPSCKQLVTFSGKNLSGTQ
jgi:hypothetical protein